MNSGIIPFKIHDSIIIKAEYVQKTIEIMNEIFLKQIGLIPSFHIQALKHEIYQNGKIAV